MTELLAPYAGLLTASFVLAVLVLVQLLVQDLAGIKEKHVPGMPVTTGHGNFHFRAVRAHANTNENLPLWLLTAVCGDVAGRIDILDLDDDPVAVAQRLPHHMLQCMSVF